MQGRRAVLEQQVHQLVHHRAGDEMVVFQDQQPGIEQAVGQFIQQDRQDLLRGDAGMGVFQQRLGGMADVFSNALRAVDRLDQVGQEDVRVAVSCSPAGSRRPAAARRSGNPPAGWFFRSRAEPKAGSGVCRAGFRASRSDAGAAAGLLPVAGSGIWCVKGRMASLLQIIVFYWPDFANDLKTHCDTMLL